MALSDTISDLGGEAKKLPMWFWLVGAGGIGYLVWRNNQNSSNTASAPALATNGSTGTDIASVGSPGSGATVGDNSTQVTALQQQLAAEHQTSQNRAQLITKLQSLYHQDQVKLQQSGTGANSSGSSGTAASSAPGSATASASTTRAYTVQPGDTLSGIGQRYGVDWHRIYSANQATIEGTARAHGFASSDSGHWIFPGEQLSIP